MTTINSIHSNPCYDEYKISMQCLDDNNYDHAKCGLVFENYKNCKKFWGKIQRIRRSEGLSPALPPPEDREKVKMEYKNQKIF